MEEFRALLSCNSEKRRLIMDFNYLPASYLHPLRRNDFIPGLPGIVWETPRVWQRLSLLILKESNLLTPFVDPAHWAWPIALRSTQGLKKIAQYSGAILMFDRIRSSLSREKVLSWKKLLGEDAYQFAMKSASLLPTLNLQESDFSDCLPENLGYGVLVSTINSLPEPMAKRCLMKIPPYLNFLSIDCEKAKRIMTFVLDISRVEWAL